MDPTPTSVTPPIPAAIDSSVAPAYASFGRRLFAVFIDGIISIFIGFVVGFAFGITGVITHTKELSTSIANLLNVVIGVTYPIYFIGSKGQTPGKMAMNIRVLDAQSGKAPGFFKAFLREIVGKIISGLVFGLGYLWPLWDQKKQAWHDKIAGTIVVKA